MFKWLSLPPSWGSGTVRPLAHPIMTTWHDHEEAEEIARFFVNDQRRPPTCNLEHKSSTWDDSIDLAYRAMPSPIALMLARKRRATSGPRRVLRGLDGRRRAASTLWRAVPPAMPSWAAAQYVDRLHRCPPSAV